MTRVGIGFDAHRFGPERRLVLGGVEIPYHKGLLGHSDADVLTHAIIDALLGAVGEGDLGKHFPDTAAQYKDISSLKLLEITFQLLKKLSYKVVNVDAVIILQEPKTSPYRDRMKQNIAKILEIDKDRVNIKATTTEGLGFTGQGEGAAAQAVVLVEEKSF
jgi:2-C-methyl-D-erythritol 2,4-cyclodiphosphate synthase